MTIEWNKVTWYSKLAAVILFVGVFWLGFWLGTMKVEKIYIEVPYIVQHVQQAFGKSSIDTSTWKTYRNQKYGFELKYPASYCELSNSPYRPIVDIGRLKNGVCDYDNYISFYAVTDNSEDLCNADKYTRNLLVNSNFSRSQILLGNDLVTAWQVENHAAAPGLSGRSVYLSKNDCNKTSSIFRIDRGSGPMVVFDSSVFEQILSTFKFNTPEPIEIISPAVSTTPPATPEKENLSQPTPSQLTTTAVDLTGINILGEIPAKTFQIAYDYLRKRLGDEYVRMNVVLDKEQSGYQANPSHQILFIDNRLSPLEGGFGPLRYSVIVESDGQISEVWYTSAIPDCVHKPALCEIHVTREQAASMVADAKLPVHGAFITMGSKRCTDSSATDITSTEGYFWSFYINDANSFDVNMSTGAVNRCRFPLGDR